MERVQHNIPPELRKVSAEELAQRRVVHFDKLEPDWDAFADAQVEGHCRGHFV